MALNHPVWDMGDKISIDSATMFNKALEIIEASVLFDLTFEKIDVIIHPQSIIHGLVHYKDGSVLANLAYPDMITPLSVALSWPDRVDLNLKKIKLTDIGNLTFIEPDYKKFPALNLGWEVLKNNKLSPIVLNAANEIAVKLFLKNKIKFTTIFKLVSEIIDIYQPSDASTIDEVIYIDNIARLKSIDYFNRKL
jgi:1-deoxy-D-xylulose-5-phosphate reductoisomerase